MAMMTKEEGQAFKLRWKLVNDRITEEIRSLTVEEKFRQLCSLYRFAKKMDWFERMREGEEEIFARWQRLRENWRQKGLDE